MFLLAKAVAPAANITRVFSSHLAAGAFCHLHRLAPRARRAVLETFVALAFAAAAADADASEMFPELRVATAYQGKFDAEIYTAAWFANAPRWSRADRIEFAAGAITDADVSTPFGFVGPVWRFRSRRRPSFLDVSFGPLVTGGSTIDGRELGGNFHFRTAIALGLTAGRGRGFEIALRIEHVSNGGLRDANPGLDSIGLGFSFAAGDAGN